MPLKTASLSVYQAVGKDNSHAIYADADSMTGLMYAWMENTMTESAA
jgi:hypothetical protein